ncbi:sugar phosphate isomerase/epimerase, partial [bacterium]|nr:sugar phosphate isomerase/epimerase [bacterium]
GYTLRLLENVPGLKLVYDTGNPVFTPDYAKGQPWPRQSSWEFYSQVKDHIAYVHIKDGVFELDASNPNGGRARFTFAGEGDGDVRATVKDLLARGYDGGISMEPHLAVVFHDDSVQAEDSVRYRNYVEYGQRFMKLVAEAKAELAEAKGSV